MTPLRRTPRQLHHGACVALVFVVALVATLSGTSTRDASATVRMVTSITYKTFGYTPLVPPRAVWPYGRSTPISRVDTGVHDSSGVRMVVIGGHAFDHPVAQARYGIDNLESYLVTEDRLYLDRAKAQAARLVLHREALGSAWFFPYRFSFAVHGADTLPAMWYSAMAQGLALSLFVRLYEATGSATYRSWAAATWLSFAVPRSTSHAWVDFVDPFGYLWLEEYADDSPRLFSDRTVNGHIFATFGVWDYWRLTRDAAVARFFDGAVSTMRAYSAAIRTPGWISRYCMAHVVLSAKYHEYVAALWQILYALTANVHFARMMDTFRDDYPTPEVSRIVRFSPGAHVMYRFDADGRATAVHTVSFTQTSQAPGDLRQRVRGHGVYYRVSAGGLSGWWAAESAGHVVMMGRYTLTSYLYPRVATLAAGTYTGVQVSSTGALLGQRTITLAVATTALTDISGFENGRLDYRVSTGALAGYWLPATRLSLQ